MRKFTLLLTLLSLILCIPVAEADVVSPYTYNFEGLTATANDFAPIGWGHVVDYYDNDDDIYYVKYTPQSSGGYGDNGACLSIGSQTLGGSYAWDYKTVSDMLVTPAITGDASIYVQLNKTGGNITFYTCSYNTTTRKFVKGSKYNVTVPELSMTAWTKVTLPDVPADTRLGICGNDVSIDEFTAASANIVLRRELTLSDVSLTSGTTTDADADGNITLSMTARVHNSGEVALHPGDENYSLSIYNGSTGETVYTQPITMALQPGETSNDIEISGAVPVAESQRYRFYVMENISGSTAHAGWVDICAYKPDFSVTTADADVIADGTTQDFGTTQTAITKEYNIRNTKGAAPLTIRFISVPDGFSYIVRATPDATETLQLPLVVAAHDKVYLYVTMNTTSTGSRSGNIVITPAEGQGTALTLPISGTVLDPSLLYVTFADGKFPIGTVVEDESWTIEKYSNGDGNYSAVNGNTSGMTKFILPKIHLNTGDALSFTATRRGSNSKLKVYYSTDREDWKLAQTIDTETDDEANLFPADRYSSGLGVYDNYKYKTFTPNLPTDSDIYIAFEAGYVRIGSIVGGEILPIPENEVLLRYVTLPENGIINHAYTASAVVSNTGTTDYAEGTLTAKLYFGETVMAEKGLPALAAGTSTTITFNSTPHKAGNFAAKIAIEGLATDEHNALVAMAEETPTGEKQVGTPIGTTNTVPSSLGFKNSDSEIIYKQEVIGLAEGIPIKGITFKGYKNSSNMTMSVDVWMENTTDESPVLSSPRSTDAMTKVYSITDLTVPAVVGGKDNMQPIYDFNFATPFVYTGGNLRIVIKERSDTYASTVFELGDLDRQAMYRRSDDPLTDANTYSSTAAPVAYLHIDKEASTLSGTVTASGTPVADAVVKIASGIVEYEGATDTDGKYAFPVYQDNKKYTLTVSKSGYFVHTETVAFNGTSVVKNVSLDKADGFKVVESNVPAEGEVNTTYTATVKLLNGIAKAADSYTAQLIVGNDIVIEAETPALSEGEEKMFTFSFVPHEVGTMNTSVKFTYSDGFVQTEPVELTISAEKGHAEVSVGEANKTDRVGAITPWNNYSRTEIVYPKSLINLAAGTKIEAIRFYGYHSAKNYQITLNAWMANVDEGTALQGLTSEGLTQVATNQIIDMNKDIPSTALEPIIEITFPDGFIYTGGDIRMLLDASADTWQTTYFELDANVTNQAQQAASDNPISSTTNISSIKLPVAHFVLSPYKTLSGTVKSDKGAIVAGARVTLTSDDDVEYYATTDAEGAFTMQVIKFGKDYTLSVHHSDYDAYTHAETISLADGDISNLAITLTKSYIFSGLITDASTKAAISGANVALYKGDTKVVETTSDAEGNFEMKLKEADVYSLVVMAMGYIDFTSDGIDLTQGDIVAYPIEMTKDIASGVISSTDDHLHIYGTVGAIIIESPSEATIRIYNVTGLLLRKAEVGEGTTRITDIPFGIYLVNGVKVIVK